MLAFFVGKFEIAGPVLVLGLITGMTYGILAVGLVLVYRSNRIINFAHGEIGAFAAALLGVSVTRWGVPYWVAFPLALVLAAAVGGAAEVVVIRRLRRAPALMSIVATLGLAQFLLFFSLVVNTQASAGRLFPQPSGLPQFDLGALRVTRAYSGMLFLVPVVVVALVLFLRRGRFGLAMRASAANPDAARLAGVFAGRMSTLSWAIAGAVSALTAILVLPTRGFTTAAFLGPGLLLRALTAAVIGRMRSLPVALGAGVAVGVLEQLLLWNYPRGGLVEAALFVVILGALVLQPRQAGRDEEKGSWAAVQAWPRLPESVAALRSVRNVGRAALAAVAAVALLLPVFATNSLAIDFVIIVAFALVGLSVGIVTGLGGQLSLGQFALAGVGATASYVVTTETGNFALGLLFAGLAAAAVSLVVGVPALRIRGLMLTVTTLGFALAAQGWLYQQSWMLGEGVDPGRPIIGGREIDTGKEYYYFTLVVFAIGLLLARNVWRSGLGRRLRALRDNEEGARSFSVPATRVKLQGFVLAGFLAGLGGAAYGHALSRISATAFPVDANISVAAMAVLGGIGVLLGPVIGALYIIGVPRFPLDNAGLAATSLGWLVLILYFPGGIAQLFRPARDGLVRVLARRAGVDPSADDAAVAADESSSFLAPKLGDRPERRASRSEQSKRSARPAVGNGVKKGGVLLEARELTRRFGGVQAVGGVTFDVAAGETLGLIGPNGAGKTTLFELISGFTRPDTGRVIFDGDDISRLGPEARARRGLIRSFQDASLFPTLTVLEVVQLSQERSDPTRLLPSLAGLRGADRRKEGRARDVVGSMGLHTFRNKQIRELSTGTRRIAELACLMTLNPKLLLLDEPSSGIAQRETEALGELLERMREHLGVTMIVIEHDIPLVMRLSDRVIAMESGQVIADGPPDVVRRDPLVVESYLGGDVRAIERSDARPVSGRGKRAPASR